MARIQIGWMIVTKAQDFVDRGFECAAWSNTVHVEAGRYPMYINSPITVYDNGELSGCERANVELPGTVVSDYFGSMFCGVPVGTYDSTQNAGKKSSYFFEAYIFQIAEWIATNRQFDEGWLFEMLPDYKAMQTGVRYSSVYDCDMPTYAVVKEG